MTNSSKFLRIVSTTLPSSSVVGRKATFGWLLLLQGLFMRTNIYIDGFNLYYGSLKDTPYKWLDLKALFSRILNPDHTILAIKLYTAKVAASLL